jgi:hypothetical protein
MIAASLRSVPNGKGLMYVNSIPEAFLVLSVFTKELASRGLAGIDFDFIGYPFAIIYFTLHLQRILRSETTPWKMYFYIIVSSLFSILLLDLEYGNFFKQLIPIILIFTVNFVIMENGDHRNIFRLYVKFAYFSAIFGIIQVTLSFVGINILIKIPGRLDSISYEPSHYASVLMPALIFTFFHFKEYKKYFMVMMLALILTFNLTGWLVFMLVISFAYINPIYYLFSVPVVYYLVFYVFPNFNENFNMRIVDTLAVFKGNIFILSKDINANGTTISLYSNLMVAQENVKNNFLTGSGLGGHEETYFRFYKGSIFTLNYYYGLNSKSAHSLTIRVLSEFGLLGFILYVVALVRRLIFLDNGVYRSISFSCFSHFLCKTFKLGAFIDYGTPFFFAMLFINFREFKLNRS